MILITGATGFIGRRLVQRLAGDANLRARVLLRPGKDADRLPRGITVHTMLGSLSDPDSLLAAMDGIHTIFHLVGTDTRGRHARLQEVDIAATRSLVESALTARVGRIVYVSRIGADRASAYPILRAKGEVEDIIRSSGLAYTIFRTSVLFGAGDRFTEHIAMLARSFPVYFVPGEGDSTFQPLWVDDLVTCLAMSLENLDLIDATMALGGPEMLTYRRIVMRVMHASRSKRPIVGVPLLAQRSAGWYLDGLFARWPINATWAELLSSSQTTELGAIERHFGFRPAALDVGVIDRYMSDRRYALELLRFALTTKWR